MRKHLYLIHFSRALVPLLVILFHAKDFMIAYFNYNFLALPDVPKSGGVYFFFALSGFMIYYLYHKEIGNPQKIKGFLISRFKRVYPFYWVLTIIILPVYFIVPQYGEGNERNVITIATSLLLLPSNSEPIIGVAWSLVHTIYFYIIFSLIFIKNKKISKLIILIWSIATLLFSLKILNTSIYLINFLFHSNNLIFLSGVACAYVITNLKINYNLSLISIIFGTTGFPLSWINTQYGFFDISLQTSTSVSSVFLILGLASIDLQTEIRIPKLATYLGNASFSLYLTNFIIMSVVSKIVKSSVLLSIPNSIKASLLIVSAIIFGCLVFSYIEKPIHQVLKKITLKENSAFFYHIEKIHLRNLEHYHKRFKNI